MRKIYDYTVIRYFPSHASEEFINIGVFLNGHNDAIKIISEEVVQNLPFMLAGDKERILGTVGYLHTLLENGTLQHNGHYFNTFRFSDPLQIASNKSTEEIIEELYRSYVRL